MWPPMVVGPPAILQGNISEHYLLVQSAILSTVPNTSRGILVLPELGQQCYTSSHECFDGSWWSHRGPCPITYEWAPEATKGQHRPIDSLWATAINSDISGQVCTNLWWCIRPRKVLMTWCVLMLLILPISPACSIHPPTTPPCPAPPHSSLIPTLSLPLHWTFLLWWVLLPHARVLCFC